jgi:predicted transcriptional regulator of viral defense system
VEAIVALALRQHGVFTLAQLAAVGIAPRAAQKRAAAARLRRVHRGVYALAPPSLLTLKGRLLAAVLACGPGATLSHRPAASLLGLRADYSTRIDVTVPNRSRRQHAGLRIHRSTTLSPADVTTVEGIPCTTVARTLLDLAEVVRQRDLERTFDQAEVEGVLNLRKLADVLERNPGRHGAAVLRRVLDEHYIGETLTWSELEERFLALSRGLGLTRPRTNLLIDPGDGEPAMRVDFAWPAQRIAVEVDGFRTHSTRQAFERDRRRDQRLTVAGWRPLRTTSRQIVGRPTELERALRALVTSRRA